MRVLFVFFYALVFNFQSHIWAQTAADYRAQLRASISFVQQSLTSFDAENTPESPTSVLLRLMNKNSTQQLCQALARLNNEEILYFFEPLRIISKKYNFYNSNHPHRRCLSTAQLRAEVQMSIASLPLKMASPTFSLQKLEPPKNKEKKQKHILGPSEELVLDTTQGPRFVFADLPKKHIALTFDDGPHPSYTKELLKILAHHKIKVTFFPVGRNVTKYGDMIRDMESAGHTLGGHTQTHPNMKKISRSAGEKEINLGFESLLKETPNVSPFFRFPYGIHTPHLRKYLKHENIGDFFWSVDTLDWKIKNPSQLYKYALKQIEDTNRGIVLFHDIQYQTIQMMPRLLETLAQRGYTVVLLKPDHYL